jgi:formylglycine-generating enzyme required for sulfatase activity
MALIAFILHDSGKDDIFADELISKSLFWKRFGTEKVSAQQKASEFLDLVARRGGMLRQNGQRYDFYIRRFREFLAGRYVAQKLEDQWNKVIARHIFNDQWEEPLQLAIGFLAFSNLEKAEKLLRQVLEIGKREDCHDRALIIAGLALGDVLKISDEQVKSVFAFHQKKLPTEILKLFEKNPPTSPTRLRYRLGLALGEIGDPRLSASPAPDAHHVEVIVPEMVTISAGVFEMGTSDEDEENLKEQIASAYSDEKTRHPIFVSEFSIGKHPVTNAEFRLFWVQKGYETEAYWNEDGWKWRIGTWDTDLSWLPDDKDLQRRYREWLEERPVQRRSQPFFWEDPHWNAPNLPVVGVSWFEAEAYTNWLKVITGKPYRLPTEAEWEKAARGPQNSLWPWGNAWDGALCNNADKDTKEKLGRTSPVGMYPNGASPCGAQDMTGNVWEWCYDWYAEDTYKNRSGQDVKNPTGPESGAARVVRGGSWGYYRYDARCAVRSGLEPVLFSYFLGFRLVLSPGERS